MRAPALALLLLASAAAGAAPGPMSLFDGKDLAGWTLVTKEGVPIGSVCRVATNGTMAVAGRPIGYLLSDMRIRNYRLHAEWRWPAGARKNSNSGFLVFLVGGPVDRRTWPVCFQIQTKAGRAGDLLPMAGATFAEPLSTPPGAKTPQRDRRHPSSERPFGQWNTCDIVCRDGTITCWINGVFQNRVTGCRPAAGGIGVQLEGFPYELRRLELTPL